MFLQGRRSSKRFLMYVELRLEVYRNEPLGYDVSQGSRVGRSRGGVERTANGWVERVVGRASRRYVGVAVGLPGGSARVGVEAVSWRLRTVS